MMRQALFTETEHPVASDNRNSNERSAPGSQPREFCGLPDVAYDAVRAFVGPDASYYDEVWRLMSYRGRYADWNPKAALYGPLWLAYRRMYFSAAIGIGLLYCLAMAITAGLAPIFAIGALALASLLCGVFGNALYLVHFRRVQATAMQAFPDSLLDQELMLESKGGVDRPGAAIVAVAGVLVLGIAGWFAS